MIRISPSLRISTTLALFTVSLLLVSDLLGLVPNRADTKLDARKKVCELLAVQLSMAATRSEYALVRETVRAFVERDPDVVSAAIRTADGTIMAQAGDPSWRWTDVWLPPTWIKVPVFQGNRHWGNVAVSFIPHGASTLFGMLKDSVYGLAIFVAVTGFLGYLFVVRRALRELDPAAVIPERVKAAFDTLTEGVLVLDEKAQIVLANGAFAGKTGCSSSWLIGRKLSELDWIGPKDRDLPWIEAPNGDRIQTGVPLRLKVQDGDLRSFSVNASLILDDQKLKRGTLVTFDDITELERKNTELHQTVAKLRDSENEVRQKAEQLHRLATRDPLTGCFNRRSFFDAFESLFQDAKRERLALSCIMTDVDHFKAINDNHGHAVGDEAIKFVAELLGSKSRSNDIVGRYGGEEFCILLPGLNREQTRVIAERIRIAVEQESAIRFASTLRFTASFGVSSLSDGAGNPKDLIEQADQALYLAKRGGRNRIICWSDQKATHAPSTVMDCDPASQDHDSGLKSVSTREHLPRRAGNRGVDPT